MELIEYTEQASSNTFEPFKNKHQIDWHLHFVKMLRPLKNQNIVEVIKWARLISWPIKQCELDIFHLYAFDQSKLSLS